MARTDPDYFPATVMNYKLGGSFSGNVNLILREEKGYTYGARTDFDGSKIPGAFSASSSVRTNTTFESVKIFKDKIDKYKEGISQEDLDFTKNALIKSNARRFESQFSLLNMLQNISAYDLPVDYIADEERIIEGMTLEDTNDLPTSTWMLLKWVIWSLVMLRPNLKNLKMQDLMRSYFWTRTPKKLNHPI